MDMRNSELRYEECDRNQFTGYRVPLDWEKRKIKKYMLEDLTSLRKKELVAKWVLFIFAFLLLLGVFSGINSLPRGELLVAMVMIIVLIISGMVTQRRIVVNKKFIENMEQDIFQVMDCKAFDANINVDSIGRGCVKICNEQGQHCKDFFLVDRAAVKEYINGEEPCFLLMKCVVCTGKKQEEFYQLFSQKGLEKQ